VKRQDARDANTLEKPAKDRDGHVSELLAAAIEVHRILGPGFLESVYEHALCVELGLRNVQFRRQVPVKVEYKGHRVGESCLDRLVSDRLVVELKAVETLAPIHWVQVRPYLKATGCLLDLPINFNVPVLLRGVRRIILTPDLASWRPGA